MTKAVIFDVGQVLYRWDLRFLFAKLIPDPTELEWFVTHVVTPQWHFQHDAGRPLAEMVPERIAEFPAYEPLIRAYATRFNETIPGPMPGMAALVDELVAANVPLFGITNFGAEFWDVFCPTARLIDPMRDVVVSGVERLMKPDPAIYRLALDRFALDPADALFIDDRAENCTGAEAMGITAHMFTESGALRRWLVEQGVFKRP